MAFSYSRYMTFKKCPLKYKFSYIDGLRPPFTESPAMARGTEIHQSIEDFLNGESEELHPDIHEFYGQYFNSIREDDVFPELPFSYNWEWNVCDFDSPDCMVRGFFDTIHLYNGVNVLEYKTGKIYPEHVYQRTLYGIAARLAFPEGGPVSVTTMYLDQRKNKGGVVFDNMVEEAMPAWKNNFQRIIDTAPEDMVANPHFGCKWCEFSRKKGGPCQF